jgi:pentatricopeptide repeat protein
LKLLRSIVNGNISGVKADAVMYANVIDAKHGCVNDAIATYSDMVKAHIEPTYFIHSSIIHGHCLVKQPEQALRFLLKLVYTRYFDIKSYLNITSFGSLMDYFGSVGRIEEALLLLSIMIKLGIQPNLVVLNSLMEVFGHQPNLVVLNSLMEVFGHACENDRNPWMLFYVLGRLGFTPNVKAVINGFPRSEKVDDALKILDHMKSKYINVDQKLLTSVVNGLVSNAQPEKALLFVDMFIEKKFKADLPCYTVFMRACFEGNEHKRALDGGTKGKEGFVTSQ